MIDTLATVLREGAFYWVTASAGLSVGILCGLAMGRKIWNEPLQDWDAAPDDDSWDEDPFAR